MKSRIRKTGSVSLLTGFGHGGLTKEKAGIDLWLKEIAPNTELRKWFGHYPQKWKEFRNRYSDELKKNEEKVSLFKDPMKK